MLTIPGFQLRLLSAKRLTKGYVRPVDVETYVVESTDPYDTHGQVQLALFHPSSAWVVWHHPPLMRLAQREAILAARNAPRRYEIRRV